MANKIRVSAVSYTNTMPFVYGLKHSTIINSIDLTLDVPAICASKLIENQADIGLVPVVALLDIPEYHIISRYCIGAVAAVNSVFIFSNKPIGKIGSLRLDLESRTSNQLAKILLKRHWHADPIFTTTGSADAFVEIGDRTFGKKDKFPFVYDLAEEWIKYSGLPFVFAVWASNKNISNEFLDRFNEALCFGLENRIEVIKQIRLRDDFDILHYLMNSVDYALDEKKRKGLSLFLELVRELDKPSQKV